MELNFERDKHRLSLQFIAGEDPRYTYGVSSKTPKYVVRVVGVEKIMSLSKLSPRPIEVAVKTSSIAGGGEGQRSEEKKDRKKKKKVADYAGGSSESSSTGGSPQQA